MFIAQIRAIHNRDGWSLRNQDNKAYENRLVQGIRNTPKRAITLFI